MMCINAKVMATTAVAGMPGLKTVATFLVTKSNLETKQEVL